MGAEDIAPHGFHGFYEMPIWQAGQVRIDSGLLPVQQMQELPQVQLSLVCNTRGQERFLVMLQMRRGVLARGSHGVSLWDPDFRQTR